MSRSLSRPLPVVLLGALGLALWTPAARAVELIPSVGLTGTRHQSDAETHLSGGLALRSGLFWLLKSEVAVMYRSQEEAAAPATLHIWPVTASLWFSPTPLLYAGGGVGWYSTTIDYDSGALREDETDGEFGVHLGGGLRVPLSPLLTLDLGGRYVFLDDPKTEFEQVETLDPDTWTVSLGVAIGF